MFTPAQLESDTIVAIATPPGRGGIAVVRLSGPAALSIGQRIVSLRKEPVSHHAHHGTVVDEDGGLIDDAVFTWSAAPHSYTTEDVVEISTHGSPVVQQAVVALAVRYGARLARPGEFTERAFLRGRLDLSAAEAVRDLIESQTLGQARLAAEQIGGSLAREVTPLKESLVHLIAMLEAGIDFAEDDLPVVSNDVLCERIELLLRPMRELEASFGRSRLVREGMKLAIVGKPNSGKSSLFNRLLGRDRSIVTSVAGTTRDTVSEALVVAGVPVQLVDTAGIRLTEDEVERLGVQRTWESVAEADLILHVVDASGPTPSRLEMDAIAVSGCPRITVLNKADLLEPEARERFERCAVQSTLPTNVSGDLGGAEQESDLPRYFGLSILTSAVTREGIQQIEDEIAKLVRGTNTHAVAGTLTNARQHAAAQSTVQALADGQSATQTCMPHEVVLLDLYRALETLDTLTGSTLPSHILERIFSTFCIGK